MKEIIIKKIIFSIFFSIVLYTFILYFGLTFSSNSNDVKNVKIISILISLLPIILTILKNYTFKENIDLIYFIKLMALGILIYIIDNIIYMIVMGYVIFNTYGQ